MPSDNGLPLSHIESVETHIESVENAAPAPAFHSVEEAQRFARWERTDGGARLLTSALGERPAPCGALRFARNCARCALLLLLGVGIVGGMAVWYVAQGIEGLRRRA